MFKLKENNTTIRREVVAGPANVVTATLFVLFYVFHPLMQGPAR